MNADTKYLISEAEHRFSIYQSGSLEGIYGRSARAISEITDFCGLNDGFWCEPHVTTIRRSLIGGRIMTNYQSSRRYMPDELHILYLYSNRNVIMTRIHEN